MKKDNINSKYSRKDSKGEISLTKAYNGMQKIKQMVKDDVH